jgi:hypothetical protein
LGFGGGVVDEILREKVLVACERAMLAAGAGSYEEEMETATKLIGKIYKGISQIRTADDMRVVLHAYPPVSKWEGVKVLFLVDHFPQVLRLGLKIAAEKAASTIPATHGGRPLAIPSQRIGEVLDYVSLLHRKGCTLEASINRTAFKFGSSERTIERLWAKRDLVSDAEAVPAHTVEEALSYLTHGSESAE